jgi:hypothetical protein
MKRILTAVCAVLVAASLILSIAGTAIAAGATITPATQSHTHGVKSTWTLSWSRYSPYEVFFAYGDGYVLHNASTAQVSIVTNRTFWPCSGHTYHQFLDIYDKHNNHAGADSYASEGGGSPC